MDDSRVFSSLQLIQLIRPQINHSGRTLQLMYNIKMLQMNWQFTSFTLNKVFGLQGQFDGADAARFGRPKGWR